MSKNPHKNRLVEVPIDKGTESSESLPNHKLCDSSFQKVGTFFTPCKAGTVCMIQSSSAVSQLAGNTLPLVLSHKKWDAKTTFINKDRNVAFVSEKSWSDVLRNERSCIWGQAPEEVSRSLECAVARLRSGFKRQPKTLSSSERITELLFIWVPETMKWTTDTSFPAPYLSHLHGGSLSLAAGTLVFMCYSNTPQ